ncbi:MAG: DUF4255 domain-containing protein [Acidobacteriota bacterium]|nr:DUF4255 domain-containing protein [Acidobacteriota bacterium]MDH3523205.1 DUF4255 domain-containing protein [Acidobacteriota bacterium]
MALPVSTLSQVCRAIADFVSERLEATQNHIRVMIGNPADAAPGDTDGDHRLNLFFYRMEPWEFGASAAPDEVWRLRLHCLVTAFGVLEDQISAGENDLRLLGELIRVFHEAPILPALGVNGETVRTRVIFQPLGVEAINHIWSTQGDVSYRPSVAYEMSLAPVVPSELGIGAPLSGALGFEVRSDMDARSEEFGGTVAPLAVVASVVNVAREDWAPRISFVVDGECADSLAFVVGSPELAAFSPEAWVAGEPGSAVTLQWEIWDRVAGWRQHPATTPATASTLGIEPREAASATTTAVALPFTDRPGQAVLYASREYVRGSDGATLQVRSNPLLVTLYEES